MKELIERLRCFDRVTCNEAADLLEQKAAEIERLNKFIDGIKTAVGNQTLEHFIEKHGNPPPLIAERDALQAKLSAMEKQEPVAYAIFTAEGNARMWSTLQPHVQKLADAEGLTVTKLYTAPKVAPLKDDDMGEGHPVLALSTKVDFLISNIKESIECDDFDGAAATLEMLRDCVSKLANGWAGALEASPQVTEPAPKVAPEQVEAAWRAGWAACRDAEYVGQEAEDEAFGMSETCANADWENAAPKVAQPLTDDEFWLGVCESLDMELFGWRVSFNEGKTWTFWETDPRPSNFNRKGMVVMPIYVQKYAHNIGGQQP